MDQSVTNGGVPITCQHCNKQPAEELRCTKCRITYYCSKAHQEADLPQHKTSCAVIRAALRSLDREERKLRALPPGSLLGKLDGIIDEFDSAVGHFWGVHETRKYMNTRKDLITALCNYGTRPALQCALEHELDCFRLCRSDNLGLRDETPFLMLRLGKDQEAYDFMKWWATCESGRSYDWGNVKLPYLNIVGANALEPVNYFLSRHQSLPHLVAMALLKYKMLRSLRDWNNSRLLTPTMPGEVVDRIAGFLDFSLALPSRSVLATNDEASVQRMIDDLENDFAALFENARSVNRYYWPCLLNPEPVLCQTPPEYTSRGSLEEVNGALRTSVVAWRQTEGAIDKVRVSLLERGSA